MEAATQIDLAETEAPAGQVVGSVLEEAADHLTVDSTLRPQVVAESRSQKRSTRGASASTYQVRLKPKQLQYSPSPSAKQTFANSLATGNLEASRLASELQPVDRGFGAWSYVASAFTMYIVVWGFPQAFPIFQTYLSTGHTSRFPGSVAIRLLAPGLQDIEEGILFQFLPKSTRYRQLLVVVGITIMSVSLGLASFATTDWQIVLLQGVLFGIGGILMNYVHVSIFPEWFDKKKGQAMGIIWTGWRLGALAFPLICQWLLDKHGFAKTLRVLIAPMLALLMPAVVLLRGRYHSATVFPTPANPPVSKLQALRAPNVLFYLFSACLFYLVVNIPKMFITTFAADVGLQSSDQAVTLSLLVLSDMLGTYIFGWLSDSVFHEGLTASIAISTSISHIFGLGFAKSRLGVFSYAIAVGLASGGFSNCLFTFFSDVSGKNGELFTAIHSLFSFFRGIAILSVGPVGAAILLRSPDVDVKSYAIGKYQYMVVYGATMSLTSGALIFARLFYRKYGRMVRLRVRPVRPTLQSVQPS